MVLAAGPPPRDGAALAAAIRRLCERPEWARALGQAARKRALSEFDEAIVIDETLEVYRELLPAGVVARDAAGDAPGSGEEAAAAASRDEEAVPG